MGRGATRAPASPFFGLRTGKGRARTRDIAERLPTLSPQAARPWSLSRRPGTPVLQREIALGSPKPWAPGAVLTPPMVFLGRERPPPGTRAAIPHCSLREVRADGVTGPQRGWGQAPGSGAGIRPRAQRAITVSVSHTSLVTVTDTHARKPPSHLVRGALRHSPSASHMVTE